MTTASDRPKRAARPRRDGRVRFRVVSSEDGLMLRQLLCRRFADLKAQSAADLIKAGGVYVDNVRIRLPSVRVASGERLTVYRAAANTVELDPKDLQIVHRDPEFVIIDKPAGVPPSSTRASARGTVAQALVHRLSGEGILRPYVGPVRPIPTGASGLILYTVRGQDAVSYQSLYMDAELVSVDLLLVRGDAPESLRCDEPLLKNRSGRLTICSPGAFGATPASTEFRRLVRRERAPGSPGSVLSLLEARALRAAGGQPMVHAAHLGFPVWRQPEADDERDDDSDDSDDSGDNDDGSEPRDREPAATRVGTPPSGTLFLHRAQISLVHPRSGERLIFESAPPPWAKR